MEETWINDGKFIELTADQMKDFTAAQHGAYAAAKNKNFVDTAIKSVETKMDNMKEGLLSKEDIANIKADFANALKGLDTEALSKYVDTIATLKTEVKDANTLASEIKEIAKTQGLAIKAMGETKIPDARKKMTRDDQLKTLIDHAFKSEAFETYKSSGFTSKTGKMALSNNESGKIELVKVVADADERSAEKAVIPISANHTGTVMISEIKDIARDDQPARKKHVRDLLNVGMTNQAQIVAGQVYDWTDALTMGAIMLSENGVAPESVFKSKENTWGLGRIANSMRISKRWFKTNGLQWVIDHVLAKLPDATYTVEDFQLLFGDGSGDNIQGLAGSAQAFNLTPNTYVATAFSSIATYNSGTQTIVTFAAAHGIKNGDTLTLANTTGTTYDGDHTAVQVVSATEVIIDQAYTADANVAANWTGSSKSIFYQAIDGAQEVDVLSVVRALLAAGEFEATGHVVNPQQSIQMGLLKATDENYLNIQKDANGEVIGVGGLPIATTTAVPAGKFFSGDFSRNGAELLEYTPLSISFVEDTTTAKANEILVLIEEEIIFPIYNPYWFMYGKFADAKTQLETP